MNASAWFSVVFVAIMWGGWPLVARVSGLNAIYVSVIGTTVGAIAVVLVSTALGQLRQAPDMKGFLYGSIAGIMLGLGMFAYSRLISNPEWEVSTLIPIAAGSITAITALGGILFFGESVSSIKWIGFISIVIGIALLS